METWVLLRDILVLLSASLMLGTFFVSIRQSPIIGYLLAGMFLGGPGSFAIISTDKHLQSISELGVCLLLFSLGLEFSWYKFRSLGFKSLLAGVLQVALTATFACIILILFSCSGKEAIALGAMISLSSTACVLRVLMERGESDSIQGRNSLSILLIQDIAVIPHAIVLTLLGGGDNLSGVLSNLGVIIISILTLVLALYILINQVAVRILSQLTLEQNRELNVLLAVVAGIGSAWAAHHINISPALGAFISGMFLGSSKFANQIRSDISSIRVVLLTLFFSSAGMLADPEWILNNLVLVSLSTISLLLFKSLVIAIILFLLGQSLAISVSTGIVLSQIGEFAFVLGEVANNNGSIRAESYQLVISVAILTMFLTPTLVKRAPRIGLQLEKLLNKLYKVTANGKNYMQPLTPDSHSQFELFIIGFGPAGEKVAFEFSSIADKTCIIDLNSTSLLRAEKLGFNTLLGDARQIDILEHVGIKDAKVVIITIPDFESSSTVLKYLRALRNDTFIIVRSRYDKNIEEFRKLGADVVIGEETESGLKLAKIARDNLPATA